MAMVKTTWMRARAPLGALAAALAAAAVVHEVRRGPAPVPAAPAGTWVLDVELAGPGSAADVARLVGAPDATVEPLFDPDPALDRWFRVVVRHDPASLLVALHAEPGAIAHADLEPVITDAAVEPGTGPRPADDDGPACPIKTPSYEPGQGYLGPAPTGIGVAAVWAAPGGRGQGIRIADVETGWNPHHEDLPGDRIHDVGGGHDVQWSAHGTAVLGELAGVDNGLGVTGIAPDVASLITSSHAARGGLALAIQRAAVTLAPGDVLLLEVQGLGPRNRYLPVEYWRAYYDVIRLATDRGIIVVEAAGNGGEDLDHEAYGGAFDRRRRDSGAIMVGAGGPAADGFTSRSRLDFSNYGSRVDVQGWGRRVTTLDYGDLQRCGGDRIRDYTAQFAGTSSASPIVAGAAAVIQGVYWARTGRRMSPALMRDILVATGSAQTDGPFGPASQHIGPLPDVPAALAELFGY